MPKSEVLLYSRSKFNVTAILYKLAICKGKIYCIVLYEIAILLSILIHWMIFNFFINISRYADSNAKRNTLLYSEIYALQDDIIFEP